MISSNPSTAQKVAPAVPPPAPASSAKGKAKETVTTIETLNSPGVQAAQLDDGFGVRVVLFSTLDEVKVDSQLIVPGRTTRTTRRKTPRR